MPKPFVKPVRFTGKGKESLIQMRIVGGKGISLKMLGIAEKLRGEILMQAADFGARLVEADAKARVPRDTGALAGSIRREVVKDAPNIAIVAVKAGKGTHEGRPIARWVEYGTSKTPAQPFLRPALRGQRAALRRYVAAIVGSLLRQKAGI